MAIDLGQIEQFLYREARFADEHRYDEWESLWTDDGIYWVPLAEDTDPSRDISLIYDNRARIGLRIRQLKTGDRHAQLPLSRLSRVVSNVMIEDVVNGEFVVRSNFVLVESRPDRLTTWAGSVRHRLRPVDESFRMCLKRVVLVNADRAVPSLAFLI
jgi:benzoate/toluate 1,2-dioxygenase beta subunit